MITFNFKNLIIFLSAVILAACSLPYESHTKGSVSIFISDVIIPKTAPVNQDIAVFVTVKAPNGCYSDIKITMYKVDSKHLLFKASGMFESSGVCPAMIVQKDTTIYYKPTVTGKYFFQFNDDPFVIRNDTVTVN